MMLFMEDIGERIKQVRLLMGLTMSEMAERLGTTYSQTVYKWEHGLTFPSKEQLEKMIQEFNVNLNWVISGVGKMFNQPMQEKQLFKVKHKFSGENEEITITFPSANKSMVDVPIYDAEVAAGFGSNNHDWPEVDRSVRISVDEKIHSNRVYFGMRVIGDSMEPSIQDGCIVIVEKYNGECESDLNKTIVVAISSSVCVVKRLDIRGKKGYLVSENPMYQSIECDSQVRIIGKVVRSIKDH